MLEEDDLDLLEENTGTSFRHRLTRLRRAHDSESPPVPSSSRRKAVVESDEEDLDKDDLEMPRVQDIHNIWDDERGAGRDDEDDMDMDDMDNFIDDDEDEQGAVMDEEEREERRRERRRQEKERRKALGGRELPGIDAR
jgi:transcription elongation factor SPT6